MKQIENSSMKIKIEQVALPADDAKNGASMKPFVVAVRDLKIGESFAVPGLTSNHRNALSILQYAYERQFAARKIDGTGAFRVFRIQ